MMKTGKRLLEWSTVIYILQNLYAENIWAVLTNTWLKQIRFSERGEQSPLFYYTELSTKLWTVVDKVVDKSVDNFVQTVDKLVDKL